MDAEMKKTLEDMGKAWEEFKGYHATLKTEVSKLNTKDVVLEETINKLTTAVADKHDSFQKSLDLIQTQMNRTPIMGAEDLKADAELRKDAFHHFRTVAIHKNRYSSDEGVEVSVDLFKQLTSAHKKFLRFGDKNMSVYSPDEAKALSVGNDPDGGIMVRPQWANYITKRIFETSPMRQLANIETVGGPEFKIPVDIDEASCGWIGETQTRAETNTPQMKEKLITAHELYALPKASQMILEDASFDIERWLADKVADKMARTENTAFVLGNGSAKPRGFLTYPDNGTTVGTQGVTWGKIEQVGSGSNGVFTLTGLTNIVGRLKEYYHPNAKWVTKRENVPAIMLLQDGNGRYVFQPIFASGYNNAPLLGYGITYAYDMPATGTTGGLAMAFGDFRAAYTIVDRIGIQILRDPYLYKPFIGFYTRKRVGGDMVDFDAIKLVKQS